MGKAGPEPQWEKRRRFAELIGAGHTIADAAREVGIHYRTGRTWLRGRRVGRLSGNTRQYEPVIVVKQPVSARFISEDERVLIADLRRRGSAIRDIATRIGRAPSTVSRELRRNTAPDGTYRPFQAHRMAEARRRRPGRGRINRDRVLAAFVQEHLDKRWSPSQISTALRQRFPSDPGKHVCAETIYQSICRSDSDFRRPHRATLLRSGRRYRRRRLAPGLRPRRLVGMVSIEERPDISDRLIPGHWEGDLIVGTGNRSAIGTLVERTSRYTILLHLGGNRSAEAVRDAMITTLQQLPAPLRKSVTWDQGNEMAHHAQITERLDMPVYLCHARSPWERPTNENTNGLLRQYLPKGTDLRAHSAEYLAEVQNELNDRPRKVLGNRSPAAFFNDLLASQHQPVLQL
ncbi:IS30 family transposase [Tsukamurella ocularis]|uniref:IS30 family transposase n=1 Tax=Tsukamurella ocularis TaxID=1970234 RepID=UPI004043ADF2